MPYFVELALGGLALPALISVYCLLRSFHRVSWDYDRWLADINGSDEVKRRPEMIVVPRRVMAKASPDIPRV